MRNRYLALIVLTLISLSVSGQDMAEYTSSWEGEVTDSKAFSVNIAIENLGGENPVFTISNEKNNVSFPFDGENGPNIKIPFADNYVFEGALSANGQEINGFVKSGLLLYHLKLRKSSTGSYEGVWNILIIDELKSQRMYLSVENGSGDEYQAYPIFTDDRFTGTWCMNFQKDNDNITFQDFKTGMHFKGKLQGNKIQLTAHLGEFTITEMSFEKSDLDWVIGGLDSKNGDSEVNLPDMDANIAMDSLLNTHSVLISRKGKVIFEKYYNGYNANVPHDMRSASKSISSAVVGIIKDQSLLKSVDQPLFDFLSSEYQVYNEGLKSEIDIKSLLTMSSGLDAIDYGKGANRESTAIEDNYQMSMDWPKSVLSASMINSPNTHANYGSANPFLLGLAMDSIVQEPLALYMDKHLFQKLDISNYVVQTDLTGTPYFGGGMYLTPGDMLKFGELYLNQGMRNGKRVISKKWIKSSLANYRNLENVADENGYGYLWWHHSYTVEGKKIATLEARGAGGQYIFVVPSMELVVVVTSGNYRNGKTQQPEAIFANYILPNLKF